MLVTDGSGAAEAAIAIRSHGNYSAAGLLRVSKHHRDD